MLQLSQVIFRSVTVTSTSSAATVKVAMFILFIYEGPKMTSMGAVAFIEPTSVALGLSDPDITIDGW
jgi:hypothetical protein